MISRRWPQFVLIISVFGFSWLAMMVTHELGHVLHAWLTGGKVDKLVLDPLTFSRTDVQPNPHPLCVAWGGAIWGCSLPMGLFAAAHFALPRIAWLARWFAGFCLIANGAYLAAGSVFSRDGPDDPGTLLAYGAARWQLLAFGLPAIAMGLYLWNGLGPRFGLGAAKGEVDRGAALGTLAAWLAILAIEFAATWCL